MIYIEHVLKRVQKFIMQHSKGKSNRKGLQVPPKGSKGWLITCDIHKDQLAIKQITGVLNHLADPIEENQETTEGEGEKKPMSLEEELAELNKKGAKKQRWVPYVSEVQGNIFIRFCYDQDDPFELLDRYFNEVRANRKTLSDRISKIFPIMASGFPDTEESLPILGDLIKKTFPTDETIVYKVIINRKHNQKTETHDELNDKILKLVGPPHKPTFKQAKWGILWHLVGRNLYMSVIPKWGEWCECSIAKFCASLIKQANEEKQEKKEEKIEERKEEEKNEENEEKKE